MASDTRCRSCGCDLQPWESEFCEGCGPLFLPAMKGEQMQAIPRTRKQAEQHPAIEAIDHTGDDTSPWWVYLAPGWTSASDPGQLHSGNGRTLRAALGDVFPVQRCQCADCQPRKANR